MTHAKTEFGAHERSCNSGVYVAVNEDHVWFMFQGNRLKANHDFCSLLCMTARTHGEVDIRGRDTELLEKDVRHLDVIVLPSVNEDLGDILSLPQRIQNRSNL